MRNWGRIYLPAEDLVRFGVTEADIRAGLRTPEFIELMDFEAARARQYYTESQPLLGLVRAGGRAVAGRPDSHLFDLAGSHRREPLRRVQPAHLALRGGEVLDSVEIAALVEPELPPYSALE